MESIGFRRRSALPGVEMLEVQDSRRSWRCFSSAFELMVPGSWHGQIQYRGVRHQVGPGMLFCPGPGDTFEITRAGSAGSFRVLMIAPEVLRQSLADQRVSLKLLPLHRVVTSVSSDLSAALAQVLEDLWLDSSTLKLLSSMAAFTQAIVSQLAGVHEPRVEPGARLAERLRELIHDVEGKLDLETLARETGLSRYQVVRAFKRSYGLPPCAYQLCLRINQAQRLLATGHTAAGVASQLGFVDQSHFTRHFKRLLGVTPSAYARAQHGSKPAGRGTGKVRRCGPSVTSVGSTRVGRLQ